MKRKPISDAALEAVTETLLSLVTTAVQEIIEQRDDVLIKQHTKHLREVEDRIHLAQAGIIQGMINQLVTRLPEYVRPVEKEIAGKNEKIANQRIQLRMYQEKLALMKTWRGIFRTIGQKLGLCS